MFGCTIGDPERFSPPPSPRDDSSKISDDTEVNSWKFALKLISKENFLRSVRVHEERPCTLLREIVLLWRANQIHSVEAASKEISREKPFMKLYGMMETRYDFGRQFI